MKKLLLICSLALLALGCNKQVSTGNNAQQQEQTKNFSYTYAAGYEGDFSDITVAFNYLASQFNPAGDTGTNLVNIKQLDNSKTQQVKVFWNGAAGFASSADFWKNTKPCSDCTKIANNITIAGATDQITYEDANTEYVVWAQDPGFVMLTLQKPFDEMLPVIQTLKVTSKKVK